MPWLPWGAQGRPVNSQGFPGLAWENMGFPDGDRGDFENSAKGAQMPVLHLRKIWPSLSEICVLAPKIGHQNRAIIFQHHQNETPY